MMAQYSETLMDHFNSPRNSGSLEAPDRIGTAGTPGRGPFMVLYVRLDGERVIEAKCQTHGCGVSIACGSMLTEMVTGRTVRECLALTAQKLTSELDGIPAHKQHCPILAISALQSALTRPS